MPLDPLLSTEQRQSPRIVALVPGELTVGDRSLPCTLEDISAGGARVLCDTVVDLAQAVLLRVVLPGPGLVAAPARLVYRFGEVGGQGSVYGLAFSVPVDLAATSAPRRAASPPAAAPGFVLVVHPQLAAGRQLTATLTGIGHRSVGVTSLAEAGGWLARASADFAAALVEGSLAQSDGGNFLAALAAKYGNLRRITLVDPLYAPLALEGSARLPPMQALPPPWNAPAIRRALAAP